MSRDLRKYANQTNIGLILGGIILVLVIGVGLIYVFYGQNAAITGALCLIVGLAPLLLIWFMLLLLEWITKRARNE